LAEIAQWLVLSATGSWMLLATTNQLSEDVAAVPFLWILPLSLYLLSFIVSFARDRWPNRGWFGLAVMVAVALAALVKFAALPFIAQICIYCSILFACCLMCHGELVNLKPSASRLTLFYLMISVGGAAGGVLVTLVAPLVFRNYYEFHIGLATCALILLALYRRDRLQALHGVDLQRALRRGGLQLAMVTVVVVGLLAMSYTFFSSDGTGDGVVDQSRNFYGSISIMRDRSDSPEDHYLAMVHGHTIHGLQMPRPKP
jgi:hypothetical protein